MKFQRAIFLISLVLLSPLYSSASEDRYKALSWRSVKLRVVKKEYDVFRPWLAPKIQIRYASGLSLGKGRILADLSSLRGLVSATAQFPEDPKAYPLQVAHLGYDCGLALLRFALPKKKHSEKKTEKKKNIPNKKEGKDKKNTIKKQEGHDDTQARKLDLKLLRNSDTDIPFIQLEEKPKKEDVKIYEDTKVKKSFEAIYLEALAFSLRKPKQFYYALAPAYNIEGHPQRLEARFLEPAFQKIDGSDIDFHWVYPLEASKQDFQLSHSGAPVLFQEGLVGILHVVNAKHAYVISAATIRDFLDDIQDGRYDGLKSSGLVFAKIQNPAERRYLDLAENTGALRVTGFAEGEGSIFEKGDVLLSVDGVSLDKDGFLFLEGRRWNVEEYLRSRRRKGRQAEAVILRGGRRQSLHFETHTQKRWHLARSAQNSPPRYFLGAGLAFVELNYDLAHHPKLRSNAAIQKAYRDYIRSGYLEDRRPIVLLKRFPDLENQGARSFLLGILRMINGRRVFGLVGLSREWKRSRDSFVVLDFYGRSDKLILPFYEKQNINHRVLQSYRLEEAARVP